MFTTEVIIGSGVLLECIGPLKYRNMGATNTENRDALYQQHPSRAAVLGYIRLYWCK